jgi:hypothetical protein
LAKINDSDELIGGSICIRVKIRQPTEQDKANGYGDARNEVGGFKSASGALPQVTSSPEPTAQPGGAKPPWAK